MEDFNSIRMTKQLWLTALTLVTSPLLKKSTHRSLVYVYQYVDHYMHLSRNSQLSLYEQTFHWLEHVSIFATVHELKMVL